MPIQRLAVAGAAAALLVVLVLRPPTPLLACVAPLVGLGVLAVAGARWTSVVARAWIPALLVAGTSGTVSSPLLSIGPD